MYKLSALRPGRVAGDILAGDGKIANLFFFTVYNSTETLVLDRLYCGEPHLCGQLPKQHTSKPVYVVVDNSYDVVGNTILCEPNMYS